MASGLSQPRAGTVESYVKWSVSHGRDVLEIFQGAENKFTRPDMSKVADYIDKWSNALGINVGISGVTPLSERQQARLLQGKQVSGIDRVTVDVTYYSPNSQQAEEEGWYVDVPSSLTGDARDNYIESQLIARFNEQYKLNMATASQVAQFIRGISIRE